MEWKSMSQSKTLYVVMKYKVLINLIYLIYAGSSTFLKTLTMGTKTYMEPIRIISNRKPINPMEIAGKEFIKEKVHDAYSIS